MKTGLVLEGGAIRTIFSSGACDALLTRNLFADYTVGVSAGIAYGVSYLSRQSGRNLEILTRYVNDKRYMSKRNLLNPQNRCYFGLKFTYETIPNELLPFDYAAYETYPGRVDAVVTNLETGAPEYWPVTAHDELHILQATCALPILFPIYHIGGKSLMDGGPSDGIPYERAFQQECDRVVVILTRERSYVRGDESLQPVMERIYYKYPAFCETIRTRAQRYNDCRKRLFELEREGKVLLIVPEDTKGFSRTERNLEKIKALWKQGYDQVIARLDEIEAFLQGK